MTLWDMIKKGAEEGLEALKEGVAVFVAEAEKQGRIIRKKVELASVQNSVRKAFLRLGSVVYDIHSRGEMGVLDQEEVKALIEQIDGYQTRVREIELEIEAIKKEEVAKGAGEGPGKEAQPPLNPAG